MCNKLFFSIGLFNFESVLPVIMDVFKKHEKECRIIRDEDIIKICIPVKGDCITTDEFSLACECASCLISWQEKENRNAEKEFILVLVAFHSEKGLKELPVCNLPDAISKLREVTVNRTCKV